MWGLRLRVQTTGFSAGAYCLEVWRILKLEACRVPCLGLKVLGVKLQGLNKGLEVRRQELLVREFMRVRIETGGGGFQAYGFVRVPRTVSLWLWGGGVLREIGLRVSPR